MPSVAHCGFMRRRKKQREKNVQKPKTSIEALPVRGRRSDPRSPCPNTESFCSGVFERDGKGEIRFPEHYPSSVLVGMVNVVDVVSAEDFSSWKALPPGAVMEGSANGSDFFFLCEGQQRLVSPFPMGGQHKLWQLDQATASRALHGLVECEQMPINFVGIAEAHRAGATEAPLTLHDEHEPSDAIIFDEDNEAVAVAENEDRLMMAALEASLIAHEQEEAMIGAALDASRIAHVQEEAMLRAALEASMQEADLTPVDTPRGEVAGGAS